MIAHLQSTSARTALAPSNSTTARSDKGTPKPTPTSHLNVAGLSSSNIPNILPDLVYHGGSLIRAPVVSTLAWGLGRNFDVVHTFQAANSFLADLPKTNYAKWVDKEYSTRKYPLRRGRLEKKLFLFNISFKATVTDKEIQDTLKQLINQKVLSKNSDGNAVTIVFLPPGVSAKHRTREDQGGGIGTTCVDFCSYNSGFKFNGKKHHYAVIPDLDCTGIRHSTDCKDSLPLLDATTNAIATEYFSMKTNPTTGPDDLDQGWVDGAEGFFTIADNCYQTDRIKGPSGITWTVPQMWSNEQKACLTDPTHPRIYDLFSGFLVNLGLTN